MLFRMVVMGCIWWGLLRRKVRDVAKLGNIIWRLLSLTLRFGVLMRNWGNLGRILCRIRFLSRPGWRIIKHRRNRHRGRHFEEKNKNRNKAKIHKNYEELNLPPWPPQEISPEEKVSLAQTAKSQVNYN